MLLTSKKLENHKYVEDYFVEKYDSGIYMICFNTHERNQYCFATSDEIYLFSDDDDEHTDLCSVEVEQFLPQDKSFVSAKNICKDQISFFYIPFDLLEDKDEKN